MSTKCVKCEKTVYDLERITALNKNFHKTCFRCKHCDNVLSIKGFAAIDGEPYCKPHYLELFKSKGNYAGITGGSSGSSGYNSSAGFKGMGNVLTAVSQPRAELKKTETVDKSAPIIEDNLKIKHVDRNNLLSQVKSDHELTKTETVDKSAPVIDSTIIVKKVDRNTHLDQVKSEHDLKHIETVDKSAPVIESVTVKKIDRVGFLESIKKGPETPLETPTAVTDRSTPVTPLKMNVAANPSCSRCQKPVYPMEKLVACNKVYHNKCFRCKHCDGTLSLKGFATIENEPYCKPHYLSLFKSKGNYAAITGDGEGKSSSFNINFKGY